MQSAATNLGVDLTIYNTPADAQNRFISTSKIKSYLSKNQKPDFIISYLWLNGEGKLISLLDSFEIPFISINSSINHNQSLIGKPREKSSFWLAHISPDDFTIGYQLTKSLVERHNESHQKPARVLAIGGRVDSSSAQARKRGLEEYVNQHPSVKLFQYINSDWSPQDASQKTQSLIKRFPAIDVVWAASDSIALGAYNAFSRTDNKHKTIGEHSPLIGGIDWSPSALPSIKNNQISLSLGGHIFDGIWAQVLIYDKFNGIDFTDDIGNIINTKMLTIDSSNIDNMFELLQPSNFKSINFKQASKCHSPNIKKYQLSVGTFIDIEG